MTVRKDNLSASEITRAFADGPGQQFGPFLGLEQVAQLLQCPEGTLREWLSKGRFKRCIRKRGKRLYFWRDRVIDEFFNGPSWGEE